MAAELAVREATVSKWVNGQGNPSRDNADKLRAAKPLPSATRNWVAYLADVRARIVANRLPPEPTGPVSQVPPPADPEVLAVSFADKLRGWVAEAVKASTGEIAEAVRTCAGDVGSVKANMPTASEVAEAVRGTVPSASEVAEAVRVAVPSASEVAEAVKVAVPSASEVAEAVRAAMPSAQDVAAEVNATKPTSTDEATVVAQVMRNVAPCLKFMKICAAISVSAVVFGVVTMVASHWPNVSLAAGPTGTSVAEDAARTGRWWAWGDRHPSPELKGDMGEHNRGRPMPHSRLPGQAVGPCWASNGEIMLYGSCWLKLAQQAPCPSGLFQEGDACYVPVREDPQVPVTDHAQPKGP